MSAGHVDMELSYGMSELIDRYINLIRSNRKQRAKCPSLDICDRLEFQDESLRIRGFYEHLPTLGAARMILPLEGLNMRFPVTTFVNASRGLALADVFVVESALLFVKGGKFVSLSRASLMDTFVSQNSFLKSTETQDYATCITIGVVASSNLSMLSPTALGSTRSVTILPFSQEFRRETTYWAEKFEESEVMTTVSLDGVKFTTRPYGLDVTRPENGYMVAGLDHYHDVPVYDCRGTSGPFDFDADSLNRLTDRPKLNIGHSYELLPGSVVAVGYALTHSFGRRGSMFVPFLHFIMVLGVPTRPTCQQPLPSLTRNM